MQATQHFQTLFFAYSLPKPFASEYDDQFIRSNDLRLLLEIATESNLRMYTDSRTSCIHFTCKKKGPNCFDLQAYPRQNDGKYYFDQTLVSKRHSSSDCHKGLEHFRYLQIYNLFKLKKNLIEDFMHENNLMKESPSHILSQLSGNEQNYFFEKHINKNLQYKRKLRKRFDNVINIDIKKIMKSNPHQEDEQVVKEKDVQKQELTQRKKREKDQKKQKDKKEVLLKKESKQKKKIEDQAVDKEEFSQSKDSEEQQEQEYQVKLRASKTKKKIHKQPKIASISKNKGKAKSKGQNDVQNVDVERGESSEQFYEASSEEDLSEIKVLNEKAEYLLYYSSSSSEMQQEQQQQNDLKGMFEGRQDYFKSLRNSTLKNSLQKQSLRPRLFTIEYGCNKQNMGELR